MRLRPVVQDSSCSELGLCLDSGPAGWSIKRISEICEINPKGLIWQKLILRTPSWNYVAIDDGWMRQ